MNETGKLSRLGVIGDVHCEAETLERVLDALESMNVERVLCVGDLVDGLGDVDSTLGLLEARGVECVAGNHERWFLSGEQRSLENATLEISDASRAFIEALPRTRRYSTRAGDALLCHGVGDDDEAWLLPDTRGYALQDMPTLRELMLDEEIQFMIGGHTHHRMVRVFPGLTVINAGTLHRKDEQSFVVLDFTAMQVSTYSAAVATAGELIEELPLPMPASFE
ncbi:MAG: metallophosphatase family protein [Deltaproteobacteria bacterium]|nr:metallophosphatase family protein [Deltaproteobacteria bacterium]NND27142.1 metallophosphoesterase family protein [Myxococcales bacterium]MBT8466733.1 metallophosphatase family protein [Deltaproteobacteria bacterium]MBT8483744.1 metallophosphatase family protein [Deltaproteobacteria bacterium]NNK08806.1 metallophosphoesterase family protein [Myxococcales bacterium]